MIEMNKSLILRLSKGEETMKKLLMSGPYLRAAYWISPILNDRRSQMVAAVDGQFIWRDKQISVLSKERNNGKLIRHWR